MVYFFTSFHSKTVQARKTCPRPRWRCSSTWRTSSRTPRWPPTHWTSPARSTRWAGRAPPCSTSTCRESVSPGRPPPRSSSSPEGTRQAGALWAPRNRPWRSRRRPSKPKCNSSCENFGRQRIFLSISLLFSFPDVRGSCRLPRSFFPSTPGILLPGSPRDKQRKDRSGQEEETAGGQTQDLLPWPLFSLIAQLLFLLNQIN